MVPDWRLIEREVPHLSISSAVHLGEGWNSHAYLVNDELVVRFPKRRDVWEELEREIAFLAYAAPRLPLPVPQYTRADLDSRAGPHGYAMYPYLRGRAFDIRGLSRRERDAAASAIAEFLNAIHALVPPPSVGLALPNEDPQLTARQYLAPAEREIVPSLSPEEASALRREIDTYLGTPANFSVVPKVLHADLSAEHIMVQNGTVSGVIDFGDVSWGDPDYDFMYLVLDAGHEFVKAVAVRYGHPDIERLMRKVTAFALIDQIDTIVNGAPFALAGQVDASWERLRSMLSPSNR